MLNFERGQWHPTKKTAAGDKPWATIRELQPSQHYHLEWHRMRAQPTRKPSQTDMQENAIAGRRRRHGDGTLIIGCFVDGHMRGAIEVTCLRTDASKAQITVSVEEAWQGNGIGTALMAEAMHAASQRGIDHLYFSCHALNFRMQRIAERVAGKVGFEDCACFADIRVAAEEELTDGTMA
jgi:RimJ/RimL family protein N-acetyltransferase